MVYRDPSERKRSTSLPIINDSLGRWKIWDTRETNKRDICNWCGERVPLIVKPHTALQLPEGIDISATILSRGNRLGLTCGCYAKLHRQVAHIQDALKRR
jgi:hypothetical protein